MDMDYKPNNHEHNSQTTTAGQPAPAAGSYRQLLLALLFFLIQHLKNLFQQLKDDCMLCWFDLQNMVHSTVNLMKITSQQLKDDCVQFRLELQRISDMMPNLMNRTSVIARDRDERKKTEELHIQKQKEEDKENNIEVVDQPSECYCGICLDFKAESNMFRGGKCNHSFCIDCISKHVASQIQQNNLEVNCPNPNCSVKLKPEYLLSILPKDVIDRWESAKYESSIALSLRIYCPFKNCSVLLVNDGNKGRPVTSSECPYCHRLFCAQCKVPWHADMSCKEFQKLKNNTDENYLDKKFLESAKVNKWPKCPNCSFYVQRSRGCEHMTCRLY